MKRRWRFRIAAIVIGLLFGLVVCEIGLRIAGLHPPPMLAKLEVKRYMPAGMPPPKGPEVIYHCYSNKSPNLKPFPGRDHEGWEASNFSEESVSLDEVRKSAGCIEYVSNEDGLRDIERPSEPPPGVSRIIVIGDSFVFGEGVPVDQTLTHEMSLLLGPSYEVFNTGVPGANTASEVRQLAWLCEKYNAKRALVVFLVNDIGYSGTLGRKQKEIHDMVNIREAIGREERSGWFWRLRIVQVLASAWWLRQARSDTIDWYKSLYSRKNARGVEHFRHDLRFLAHQPGGCETYLVLYPLIDGLESYPLTSIHETVTALAGKFKIPVLDLLSVFAGKNSVSLQVDSSDHHPNGKAHKIAATAIVDWLRKEHPDFLSLPTPPDPAPPPSTPSPTPSLSTP